MLETSARLLRLLSLFQQRRYWSGAALAERLEVTPRTLRRDVDKLRTLGYPVHSTSGVEGGYQLGAGSAMPPLLLDDEEALAVALGLRLAAAGAVEGIAETSVRALAKLEQILPPRLRRRVSALQAAVLTPAPAGSSTDAGTLSAIAAACRDNETLHFRYRDHGGAISARSVEPHRIVHSVRQWYLVAWDLGRRDWRTFRVDRIERRPRTGVRFVPRDPPATDLAAYVTRGIWNTGSCRGHVTLLLPAEKIAERLPPYLGVVEPIDARSCSFQVSAPSFESLAMHLALLGVDFEVQSPKELLREVRRLRDRYSRAAGA